MDKGTIPEGMNSYKNEKYCKTKIKKEAERKQRTKQGKIRYASAKGQAVNSISIKECDGSQKGKKNATLDQNGQDKSP